MAEVKRVLVVDDHFEMMEFLRSILEFSGQEYQVQAVPSAEEGLLEMRQTEFDLLITDVRLPGISGLDLVRRVQRFRPNLPAIVITAYSSEQGRREAAALGVYRYFQKPLDTDEMLASVHGALFGDLIVYPDEPTKPEEMDFNLSVDIKRRLEALRADTGAAQLTLATVSGRILAQLGGGRALNLPKLTTLMAENLENSFLLGRELGGDDPTTIQYHSANQVELYIANVGRDYFLAIFFDVQARRGRMGTIWVFAQRAIKDLLTMLPSVDMGRSQTTQVRPDADVGIDVLSQIPSQPSLPSDAEPSESGSASGAKSERTEMNGDVDIGAEAIPELSAPTEADGFFTLDEVSIDDSDKINAFWDEAVIEEYAESQTGENLSYEEARQQGLLEDDEREQREQNETNFFEADDSLASSSSELSDLLEVLEDATEEPADLNDYWETALSDASAGSEIGAGLSFEEARQQGLVSPDMGQKQQATGEPVESGREAGGDDEAPDASQDS